MPMTGTSESPLPVPSAEAVVTSAVRRRTASSNPRAGRGRRAAAHAALAVVLAGTGLAGCKIGGDSADKAAAGPPAAAPLGGAPGTGESPGAGGPSGEKVSVAPQLAYAWSTAKAVGAETGDTKRLGLLGTWQAGNTLFVGRGSEIAMLDVTTGRRTGAVAPPEPGLLPCAMTPALNRDGMGAVAWLDHDDAMGECGRVSLVDARNGGKVVWSRPFSGTDIDGREIWHFRGAVGFAGDDLVAAMTPTSVVAFRAADGANAWTWESPVPADEGTNQAMVASPDLVAVQIRHFGEDKPAIVTVDTAGKQISAEPAEIELLERYGDVDLLSSAPLSVVVRPATAAAEATKAPEVRFLDRDGTVTRSVPLTAGGKPTGVAAVDGQDGRTWFGIRVVGTTMYAVTRTGGSADGAAAGVGAFDVTSGAQLWHVPAAVNTTPVMVGADESGVYVFNAMYFGGSGVVSYAAKDGRATNVSTVSPEPRGPLVTFRNLLVDVVKGRLLFTDGPLRHGRDHRVRPAELRPAARRIQW